MKKFLSIFFIVIVFFSIGGYFVSFKLNQWNIKKIVFEAIRNEKLNAPLIKIKNNPTIDWKEEGKEFEFMGNMYDVVKCQTTENGDIIYYCFDDRQESQLIHLYKKIEKHSNKKNKNKLAYSFNLFAQKIENTNDYFVCSIQLIDPNYQYQLSKGFINFPYLPPSL